MRLRTGSLPYLAVPQIHLLHLSDRIAKDGVVPVRSHVQGHDGVIAKLLAPDGLLLDLGVIEPYLRNGGSERWSENTEAA